jgi:drug/metabolite transporter (DMT)-like permease
MVLFGVYVVISPTVTRKRSALSATAISTWMAIPFLLGTAALEWQHKPPTWSWHLLLAVLYIGIFPSLGAFLAWNEGVRRVGPNRAMAFYNMLPVYGAILGVVLLGESPAWQHFIGGGLIIMSSLITICPELKGRGTKM